LASTGIRARAALAALVAASVAIAAPACSSSGGDKAGGVPKGEPLVLTLESEDDLTLSGAPEFADAVKRRSHGTMQVKYLQAGRGSEVDFERGVVEDVRAGRAQLGIVGARVWDTLGVRSFEAIHAPFLVDSFELERRVLESPLATQMLEQLEQAGVVGIALLPGPLRQPLGLSRPLIGPDDYRGATIGIRLAGVASTALRALKADAKGYVPGSLSGLDGVETDPKTIDFNGWEGILTADVVLWPKPYSIFMNRKEFEALTSEQQELLSRAGRDSLEPELRQTERDAEAAIAKLCKTGQLSFVAASRSELAALREAVQPVYDELERDPLTRRLLAEIENLRRPTSRPPSPSCRPARQGSADKLHPSPLEGRWQVTWTRDDLRAAGLSVARLPKKWSATVVYEFANGRFEGNSTPRETGTYTVDGDLLGLVFKTGRFVQLGKRYALRWSVYRDKLTLSLVPGEEPIQAFAIKPWTRVR